MNPPVPFHAIIVAAGSGSRAGGEIPKQYMEIDSQPVLRHTVNAFLACPGLRSLRVVIDPAHRVLYDAAVGDLPLLPPVAGGETRKESVFNGISSIKPDNAEELVLIHDAARPFVTPAEIAALTTGMADCPAASLALPIADTLRHSPDGRFAAGTTDRTGLWAVQTPQAFRYHVIIDAHNRAGDGPWTDDSGLASAAGYEVALVPGRRDNFKITSAEDLRYAGQLMKGMKSMRIRTGLGFDVHAFAQIMGGPVRICGVDIDYPRRLYGHSDADVGLHAITDALLGAAALGDIGQHFPPTDPQWKNADSSMFLREAVRMLSEKQAEIVNIDIVIICEEPRIGPHRERMQHKVAEICGIAPDQVNVKATTTEKLGAMGRAEGISAQAIATIQVP